MGLILAVLSLACGFLLVLLSNPLQVMPRLMQPLRYRLIARIYRRWQCEYRIKSSFFRLMLLSTALLLLWFLLAMSSPIQDNTALARLILGLGIGGVLAWSLCCRRELLFGHQGIIGFYPNPRLIVTWNNLAGYYLITKPRAIILVAKSGQHVEAIPIASDLEQRDVELALMPHLKRLDPQEWPQQPLPDNIQRQLTRRDLVLGLATLPLLASLILSIALRIQLPDWQLALAIGAAVAVPSYMIKWSEKFRMRYYSLHGHVSVAQLVSLCQRCFYQAVCWQSGLHRKVQWDKSKNKARVPTWAEFSQDFPNRLKISEEVYHTCCQCLVGHMRAQDLYHIKLIPLRDLQQKNIPKRAKMTTDITHNRSDEK